MDPTKRELRQEKRELKRDGSKFRRRSLKQALADDPEGAPYNDSGFGRFSSAKLNGIDRDHTRKRVLEHRATAPNDDRDQG